MESENYQKFARDLFVAMHCGGDFFRAKIYELFGKADGNNMSKLTLAYPVEARLWMEWQGTPVEVEFFEKYNVGDHLIDKSPEKALYERMTNRDLSRRRS